MPWCLNNCLPYHRRELTDMCVISKLEEHNELEYHAMIKMTFIVVVVEQMDLGLKKFVY